MEGDPGKSTKKPKMTDEERLELAAKLDDDLEEFMAGLPKRAPQEIQPFDQWQEEVLNHPFFMKELPKDGEPMHPLYEGLQKLKYDPNENEPEELANSYKDDGNFHFKYKKYRMAVISYTEGLKAKCGNVQLDANLYNNRAAAQYNLENYRSAIQDCDKALKLAPKYEKALVRLINCYFKLEKYEQAVENCDLLLEIDENHKLGLEIRAKAVNGIKIKQRNERKKLLGAKKAKIEQETIIQAILKRGIAIEGGADNLTLSKLEPQFPQLYNARVFINSEGKLVWPVVFIYPEYKIMDYIQQFEEETTIREQLSTVFEENPEWDKEKKYNPNNVNVYYENNRIKNVKVDLKLTLLLLLQRNDFVVKSGTPSLIILVNGSEAEKTFLKC